MQYLLCEEVIYYDMLIIHRFLFFVTTKVNTSIEKEK